MTGFAICASDFASSFKGRSELIVDGLFKRARVHAPSVIFFDEVDAIMKERGFISDAHHEREKATMLVALQNARNDSTARVRFIAATNHPWSIDVAFLRRFQSILYVPLPDRCDLCLHVRANMTRLSSTLNVIWSDDIDVSAIAGLMEQMHYSGADVADVFESALTKATEKARAKGTASNLSFEQMMAQLQQGQQRVQADGPLEVSHVLLENAVKAHCPALTPEIIEKYSQWAKKFSKSF